MSETLSQPPRAFRIHADDNVATLLEPAAPGPVEVSGHGPCQVTALETIAEGHKIALADIAAGRPVVKYGLPIGAAARDIRRGQWVHLHNLHSNFDERSNTLDVQTGVPTDIEDAYA